MTDGKEINLEERIKPGSVPKPASDFAIATQNHELAKNREEKRGEIAMMLLRLLVVVVVAPFVLVAGRGVYLCWGSSGICSAFPTVDDVLDLIQLVLTPVVALVGAATGFYFGERKGG